MRRVFTVILFAISMASWQRTHAFGIDFDLTADFSKLDNVIDVDDPEDLDRLWSLGFARKQVGSDFEFERFNVRLGTLGWKSSVYSSLDAPAVWQNSTGTNLGGVEPGQISMHAGPDVSSMAIIRFRPPEPGSYSFFGQFFPGDRGIAAASIRVGPGAGGTLDLIAKFEDTGVSPFVAGGVFLDVGMFLYFTVENTGSFLFGNTPVDIVIQRDVIDPVPVPPLAWLFAGSAILLLQARRPGRSSTQCSA